MPYYTINHLTPLTMTQKDSLAEAITTIHSTRFSTLRNFVNVRFHQLSASEDLYTGGQRRVTNHVIANVRSGPSRSQSEYDALCAAIQSAWDRIVIENQAPRAKGSGGGEEELELRAVFVIGGLLAGLEAGVAIPPAGGDGEWLSSNWRDFVERAERGEQEWVENVKEVRERGMVDEGQAGKTAQQRLEEALGWGDSA